METLVAQAKHSVSQSRKHTFEGQSLQVCCHNAQRLHTEPVIKQNKNLRRLSHHHSTNISYNAGCMKCAKAQSCYQCLPARVSIASQARSSMRLAFDHPAAGSKTSIARVSLLLLMVCCFTCRCCCYHHQSSNRVWWSRSML